MYRHEKRNIYFTIKPEMVTLPLPQFLYKHFPEGSEDLTFADLDSNQTLLREYGGHYRRHTHKATGNEVLLYSFQVPSLIGGEMLELIQIMAQEEMPTTDGQLTYLINDLNENIPDTVLSMFLPGTFKSGQKIRWIDLKALSETTEDYTAVFYELKNGKWVVEIPDMLLLIWGIFRKVGYPNIPEVAIYTTPTQVKENLEYVKGQ